VGLCPPGSEVDAGHLVAAFDSLYVGLGLCTPPSTCSATGKRYWLSARKESMNSKRSSSNSKMWRSYCSPLLSLANWIKWDLTLSTCARTCYLFERIISNVGRCFSVPLSWSPLCAPPMLWTKCCFAALQCSSMSPLSTSVGLQMMLSQCVTLHNWLSPSRLRL